jgi:hypothetical protein
VLTVNPADNNIEVCSEKADAEQVWTKLGENGVDEK